MNAWVPLFERAQTRRHPLAKLMSRHLSFRERRFVAAYLGPAGQNASEAARLAGYSAKTAHVAGSRLLSRVNVREKIQQARAELQRRLDISVDAVAQELARIGFADVRQLFNADGRLRAIEALDPAIAAAISSIKLRRLRTTVNNDGDIKSVVEEALIEVKLSSKVDALVALARTLGMFKDKAQDRGRITYEELVAGSYAPNKERPDR